MKHEDGKDLIVYGGGSFLSSLIRAGVVDEFQMFVNPVALGAGMTIFTEIDDPLQLTLVKSKPHACGIVVHTHRSNVAENR